jgi:hypothetical protein
VCQKLPKTPTKAESQPSVSILFSTLEPKNGDEKGVFDIFDEISFSTEEFGHRRSNDNGYRAKAKTK